MVCSSLTGMNAKSLIVDGNLPGDTVPDSSSNIFISAEGMSCLTQADNLKAFVNVL